MVQNISYHLRRRTEYDWSEIRWQCCQCGRTWRNLRRPRRQPTATSPSHRARLCLDSDAKFTTLCAISQIAAEKLRYLIIFSLDVLKNIAGKTADMLSFWSPFGRYFYTHFPFEWNYRCDTDLRPKTTANRLRIKLLTTDCCEKVFLGRKNELGKTKQRDQGRQWCLHLILIGGHRF